MRLQKPIQRARVGRTAVAAFGVMICLSPVAPAHGDIAFVYDPLAEPITSAVFEIDLAAMNAHRTVTTVEMNFMRLVDCRAGSGLSELDLSDDLFGTSAWPAEPQLDMGVLETAVLMVNIPLHFYPALSGGRIGLHGLLTDTVDAAFAIDYIGLTIQTATATTHVYYGSPVGNENDGYGIGLADGGDLPMPLPDALPSGTTGTGFDETISSKAIYAIPEPTSLLLLVCGFLLGSRGKTARARPTTR
jgi:hypothetical protein